MGTPAQQQVTWASLPCCPSVETCCASPLLNIRTERSSRGPHHLVLKNYVPAAQTTHRGTGASANPRLTSATKGYTTSFAVTVGCE